MAKAGQKPKMRTPPLDKGQIEELRNMARDGVPKAVIAGCLGMSQPTLNKLCDLQPEAVLAYKKGRAEFGREAAGIAAKTMRAFDTHPKQAVAMTMFILKTQFGYQEKAGLEITNPHETASAIRDAVKALMGSVADVPDGE